MISHLIKTNDLITDQYVLKRGYFIQIFTQISISMYARRHLKYFQLYKAFVPRKSIDYLLSQNVRYVIKI